MNTPCPNGRGFLANRIRLSLLCCVTLALASFLNSPAQEPKPASQEKRTKTLQITSTAFAEG